MENLFNLFLINTSKFDAIFNNYENIDSKILNKNENSFSETCKIINFSLDQNLTLKEFNDLLSEKFSNEILGS